MTYLYIDSSNYLTLGLLNEKFEWLEYTQTENLKSSSMLHGQIYEMLSKFDLKVNQLDSLFLAAGPGSYTGIRLSEGLAQILEWQNFKISSFYHFEVPYLLGEEEGAWYSQAFKGEFFVYEWIKEKDGHKLLKREELDRDLSSQVKKFSHYQGLLEGNFIYTSDLIKENSNHFFKLIKDRGTHLQPFYFRNLEQEFTVPGRSIR